MVKECIICVLIVVIIVLGNVATQNYTVECVNQLSNNLLELRSEIPEEKQEKESEKVKNKVGEIYQEWKERHDKLAYYIEHDELEKVETTLTSLKSHLEREEYSDCLSELDQCVFLLKHIEDKYDFKLQNIF